MSTSRPGAQQLIASVVDADSYVSWDQPLDLDGLDDTYRPTMAKAAERAGTDESILTGRATIRGHEVALIVGEFRFLGGSIGRAAAGRIAEPGALIGFLGPVVYETVNGVPFPDGVQLAENLVDKGIVDAVVPVEGLADIAARALTLLSATTEGSTADPSDHPAWPVAPFVSRPEPTEQEIATVWAAIETTRRQDRPGVRELLRYAADDVIPLNGTGFGESDKGVMLALASFGGRPCVLVGQDRRYQVSESMGPAALREARRGMRMATELGLPLVTVIDTPGADLSPNAEEGALAGEIARCIADMTSLTVPSVSVLLGEGTGGGALALLPARRVIAAGNAWLSPLPPEGASAIVFKDTDHAPLLAARQRVGARQMLEDGLVDVIVAESPAAHEDPEAFAAAIGSAITAEIDGLLAQG